MKKVFKFKKRKPRTAKPPALETVEDPELLRWAEEMRRRRQELADPKRRRFVVSRFTDVDGQEQKVARKQSEPLPLAVFVKPARRRVMVQSVDDIKLVREAWERAVGPMIAAETRVYSYKKGVLTIEVLAGSLLQEIRQFHKHEIFASVSDVWTLSTPLIRIVYRLGRK